MLGPVSLQQVLEVVAEFDDCGGASLGLVAWELCLDEELVAQAWQQALSYGLIRPAGRDWKEQLWRLSAGGWVAARTSAAALQAGRFSSTNATIAAGVSESPG